MIRAIWRRRTCAYYGSRLRQRDETTSRYRPWANGGLAAEEVRQVEPDINSQIYARDFALIDQAEMIVSFIPELPDGRPALSSGVERELQHAHEAAKQVYVIWTPKTPPSVFITQTANKVFHTPDEVIDYFRNHYPYASDRLFE